MDKITERHLELIIQCRTSMTEAKNHATITAETAQGFAEWCSMEGWDFVNNSFWTPYHGFGSSLKSTSELYAMYIEQLNQEG